MIRRGKNKSLIDEEGNLVFPVVTAKKLNIQYNSQKKVIPEVEKFLESGNFSDERILELQQFKKDLEDMKILDKVECKKKYLETLKSNVKDIEKYKEDNDIK